jgi:ABC-2 type transport system permease protein
MSLVMFRRALKDQRWTVVWYALGLFLYGVMILSFYPSIGRNAELMQQYLKSLPEAMLRAFGIADMGTLPGFIGAEFLNFMWPLITAVFVILTGASLVAQEVERGTAELWLSVPESRGRLLAAKLVALLVGIVALVLATIAALVVGAALVGESVTGRGLLAMGVVLLAFAVAVGGYAALFSSFSSDRGRPAGLAAALTLASYLAGVIGGINGRWGWLKRLSIFTAYQPQQALARGDVPVLGTLALLALGLACAAAAIAIFQRRDVLV